MKNGQPRQNTNTKKTNTVHHFLLYNNVRIDSCISVYLYICIVPFIHHFFRFLSVFRNQLNSNSHSIKGFVLDSGCKYARYIYTRLTSFLFQILNVEDVRCQTIFKCCLILCYCLNKLYPLTQILRKSCHFFTVTAVIF